MNTISNVARVSPRSGKGKATNLVEAEKAPEKVAEKAKETATAETPENGKEEIPGSDRTVTPKDNKAPRLVHYVPTSEDEAHAIQNLSYAASEYKQISEKFGAKFEQMALYTADLAYFLFRKSMTQANPEGSIPSFDTVKKALQGVMNGRVTAVEQAGKDGGEPVLIRRDIPEAKLSDAEKAAEKKLNNGGKLKDRASGFVNIAVGTANQYIDTACMAALLLLCGSDTIRGIDGTTYRRGYRYLSNNGRGFKSGEPVLTNTSSDKKNPKWEPLAILDAAGNPTPQPEGTYVGIIFNDHVLHPKVEVDRNARTDEPVWALRADHRKYYERPWVGATIQGIKADYRRFFELKADEIDPNTGYEKEATRTAGGTQSETGESSGAVETGTANAPTLLEAMTTAASSEEKAAEMPQDVRTEFFKSMLRVVKTLPKKKGALNEDQLKILAEVLNILDGYMLEMNDDDVDAVNKAMNA